MGQIYITLVIKHSQFHILTPFLISPKVEMITFPRGGRPGRG